MVDVPQFAPGCFGSALAFKANDNACTNCVFRDRCEPAHLAALAALRIRFKIAQPETRAVIEEKRSQQAQAERDAFIAKDPEVMALPVKVQQLAMRLDRGEFRVLENLNRRVNPFIGRIPFLAVAAEILIKFPKPVDRQLLATCFMTKFDWQQGTADAHARMAIQVLTHVGAVENVDGRITLRRTQNG